MFGIYQLYLISQFQLISAYYLIIVVQMKIGLIKEWIQPGQIMMLGDIKLKPMQNAIINCNKNFDVLVNLPTGFGKSILFQYPASKLVGQSIIVFVPLKALLWDCLKQAELHKLTAEQCDVKFVSRYYKSNYLPKLLFLTPQRFFQNQTVRQFLKQVYSNGLIDRIIIDEAHCISQWGSDFRPDYAKLSQLKEHFPEVRLLGMSATIPPEARNDLVIKLKIPGSYYFQSSSNRTNLIYEVHSTQKKQIPYAIIEYLRIKKLTEQYGIVYCQTIKHAEEVYENLIKLGFDCCLFHSKMKESQRQTNFDDFMNNRVKCIIATICFGMGVNKKNIRYVINAGISLSAENYYQQSGRAGRDGQLSYCLLLTYKEDVNPLQYLICESTKIKKQANRRIYKLNQLKTYTKTNQCRKRALFKLLGQDFEASQCKKTCDYCRQSMTQQAYKEIDLTEFGKLIIEELQKHSRQKVTKIQLCGFLKGKDSIKNKLTIQKLHRLFNLFKDQSVSTTESFIQQMINKGLLLAVPQKVKLGKFKRFIEYLKPCSKVQLKKHTRITIKIKMKPVQNQGLKEMPHKYDKFQKYLKDKKKTQEITTDLPYPLPLILKKKDIQQYQSFKSEQLFEDRPNQYYQVEEDDLKQVKIVNVENDYNHYFDQLFPENSYDEIAVINKEQFEAIGGSAYQSEEMEHLKSFQMEKAYLQKQETSPVEEVLKKGVNQQKKTKKDILQQLMDSDSSIDQQILALLKKKREKKQKQNLQKSATIIRKNINLNKFQFL